MKTIKESITNEIVINKSKFITYLLFISSKEEAQNQIELLKNKYKDATHVCYAYIVDNYEKYSDDKEPNGTAGLPILQVLKNKELNNVLCVVIRYFGGIKLGTGGLLRAYKSSVVEALEKCETSLIVPGYQIKIKIDYTNIKQIDYLLKNYHITKSFKDDITYEFKIPAHEYEIIKDKLLQYSSLINKEKIKMTI